MNATKKKPDPKIEITRRAIGRFDDHFWESGDDDELFCKYLSVCFPKLFFQAIKILGEKSRKTAEGYSTGDILDYMLTARYEELLMHRLKGNDE